VCILAVLVLSIELPPRSDRREVSVFPRRVIHSIIHPGSEVTEPVLQSIYSALWVCIVTILSLSWDRRYSWLPADVSLSAFPKTAETEMPFIFKCIFNIHKKSALKSTQIIRNV